MYCPLRTQIQSRGLRGCYHIIISNYTASTSQPSPKCRQIHSTAGPKTKKTEAKNESTVKVGTDFENRSITVLKGLSMELGRVGGPSDGGIDLQGWWWLPKVNDNSRDEPVAQQQSNGGSRSRIRILAQCKAESKKLGPNYVREMEGVLHRLIVGQVVDPEEVLALKGVGHQEGALSTTIAMIISQSAFSKSAISRVMSSPIPFLLVFLPRPDEDSDTDGEVASIQWNGALGSENGILKGHLEVRWERSERELIGKPGLWWKGLRLQSWTPSDI